METQVSCSISGSKRKRTHTKHDTPFLTERRKKLRALLCAMQVETSAFLEALENEMMVTQDALHNLSDTVILGDGDGDGDGEENAWLKDRKDAVQSVGESAKRRAEMRAVRIDDAIIAHDESEKAVVASGARTHRQMQMQNAEEKKDDAAALAFLRIVSADAADSRSKSKSKTFEEMLVDACRSEDPAMVALLLKHTPCDPCKKPADGSFALRVAVLSGCAGTVQILLKDGRADPTFGNQNVYPLLFDAVGGGNTAVVDHLLKDGRVDPAAQNNQVMDFFSQGTIRAVCKRAPALELLLKDGRADPTVNESFVLRDSAAKGMHEILQKLLQDGRADPAARNSQALQRALFSTCSLARREKVVHLLLKDRRADPAAHGFQTLVFDAITINSRVILEQLLEDGRADPAAEHSVALREAVKKDDVDAVKLLLKDGRADPADSYSEVLFQALENSGFTVMEMLLADGRVDPTVCGSELLSRVIKRGHIHFLRLLLSDGRADPRADKNIFGTLLKHVRFSDEVLGDCAAALLADGRANPAAQRSEVLVEAVRHSKDAFVRQLMADGRVDPAECGGFDARNLLSIMSSTP